MSSIQVTATVEATTTPPRVRLDVVDSVSPLLSTTTITRLNPDGTSVPVRTLDGNPLPLTVSGSTTVGLLYDYEAPYGQQVTYSSVETPGNISAAVEVDVPDIWLVHPAVPSLSMPVTLRPGSLMDETLTIRQGVFYPMGRDTPITVNDGARKSAQSSLIVATQTVDELNALRALISDAGVLLLNVPPTWNANWDTGYIAVSEVKISRWTDAAINSYRDATLPFTVVDRPAGGSTSGRTYVDLLSYATYSALQNAYGTYLDVLAGP